MNTITHRQQLDAPRRGKSKSGKNSPNHDPHHQPDGTSMPAAINNNRIDQKVEYLQYQEGENGLTLVSPSMFSSPSNFAGVTPMDSNMAQFYEFIEQSQGNVSMLTPNFDQVYILGSSQKLSPADYKRLNMPTESKSVPVSPTGSHPHKLTAAQKEAMAQLRELSESSQQTTPLSGSFSETKRQLHIQCEQKRRAEIKNGFEVLRMEIPSMMHRKASKAVLLSKTIDYMRQIKRERECLAMEVEHLQVQLQKVKQAQE